MPRTFKEFEEMQDYRLSVQSVDEHIIRIIEIDKYWNKDTFKKYCMLCGLDLMDRYIADKLVHLVKTHSDFNVDTFCQYCDYLGFSKNSYTFYRNSGINEHCFHYDLLISWRSFCSDPFDFAAVFENKWGDRTSSILGLLNFIRWLNKSKYPTTVYLPKDLLSY